MGIEAFDVNGEINQLPTMRQIIRDEQAERLAIGQKATGIVEATASLYDGQSVDPRTFLDRVEATGDSTRTMARTALLDMMDGKRVHLTPDGFLQFGA